MKYRDLVVWTVLVGALVVGRGLHAEAGDPQEQIRHLLDNLRVVLTDETLKVPEQSQQRQEKIETVAGILIHVYPLRARCNA